MRALGLLLLLAVAGQPLIGAVNIVYDETGWTKVDWHKYKIDFDPGLEPSPADELISSEALRKALGACRINSLDGPVKRTPSLRAPG